MTREELERIVARQVLRAVDEGRRLAREGGHVGQGVEVITTVILANVDAHLAREVEAAIERLAGAEPHAPHG